MVREPGTARSDERSSHAQQVKQVALGIAALGGAAVGGAAVAGAATSHSGTQAATVPNAGKPALGLRALPAPGTASHEDAEKAVTGTPADKAQAAAEAVGGGTAGDVTTDYVGNGYEVTVTKSDGSKVEIHLDGSFDVMARPPGGRGGAPPPSRSFN